MRKIVLMTVIVCVVLVSASFAVAAMSSSSSGVNIPPGVPVTLSTIDYIVGTLTNFILYIGGTVATFMVVLSGILWTTSGGDPKRLETAKTMLRAAIIGAMIILAVGVILRTIENCFQGGCFPGGGPTSTVRPIPPPPPPPPRTGKGVGESCRANQECEEGLHCEGLETDMLGVCLPE